MTTDEAKALLIQAGALTEAGRHREALPLLERVEEAFPSSARAIEALGECRAALGDREGAEVLLVRVTALSGPEAPRLRARIEAMPEAAVEAMPQPEAQPETEPQPVPQPEAQPETEPQPVPQPEAQPGPETQPVPDIEPEPKPEAHAAAEPPADETPAPNMPPPLPLAAEAAAVPPAPAEPQQEWPSQPEATIQPDLTDQPDQTDLTDQAGPPSPPSPLGPQSPPSLQNQPAPADNNPAVREARRLLEMRHFAEAGGLLARVLETDPDDAQANLLLARVHLDGDFELQDFPLALALAEVAVSLSGGAPDAAVVHAFALGANGREEEGFDRLRALHDEEPDPDRRVVLARALAEYRERFCIPDTWQFLDDDGLVLFQSPDIDAIRAAIRSGVIPKTALCRKNEDPRALPVGESIAREVPQIAALFGSRMRPVFVLALALGFLALVAWAVIPRALPGIDPAARHAVLAAGAAFSMAGVAGIVVLFKRR